MKAIFDVGHPAHVHLFKYTINNLIRSGWEIQIVAREREITIDLLKAYGFEYLTLKHYNSLIGKVIGLFLIDWQYLKIARKFQPDVIVSVGSPFSAHISQIIGKPHIAFSDTPASNGTLFYIMCNALVLPFTDKICTPNNFPKRYISNKHVKYNGYHELAYLHPAYFSPNPTVLEKVGLSERERFAILRFASWDAIHDVGQHGFRNCQDKIEFVRLLERHCKVLITSEISIPEFSKYEVSIEPEEMHDLLSFATMYVGEGATMASEAGVLGVPWIFLYTKRLPYLDDQETNYGLGITVTEADKALEQAINYLKRANLREQWMKKKERLLEDKIDVTQFMTGMIKKHSNLKQKITICK